MRTPQSLFNSFVVGSLLAASAAQALPPVSLQGAPFEVRWQGQKTFRASSRQAWQGELPPPTGIGNLASGQWRWGSSLDSIDFSPSGWLIRGVRASISVDSVGFKSDVSSKGFGLNVECHDLRLEFTPGDVALPIPAPMTFQVVADGGRLRARAEWDATTWVRESLRPLFEGDKVDQNLRLTGQCTGGLQELGEKLLRSRMRDMPTKDPGTFQKLTDRLAAEASRSLKKSLEDGFPGLPAGVPIDAKLQLVREGNQLVLRPADLSPDFIAADLRPQIQGLTNTHGIEVQATFSELGLNRVMAEGLVGAALVTRQKMQDGTLLMDLPQQTQVSSLSSVIGELAHRSPTESIRIQLGLPLVDAAANPVFRLRPWISSMGLTGGFDLQLSVDVNFFSNADELLAHRRLTAVFRFQDDRDPGELSLKYIGGQWLPEKSEVGTASPELGITLDWVLNSDMLKDKLQPVLTQAFRADGMRGVSFQRLGHADEAHKRAEGGFYSEGLVINYEAN